MKSTLIFLSFFLFSFVLQAQTEITYTDSAGVITATIKEVQVIEKISFTNTTDLTFNDEEKAILFQGGIVSKNTKKMTQFFLPTFSDIMEQFSVKDNNIELINKKESKSIVDWWFLFGYLIIPFFLVLYIGFLVPQKPKILYFIYYIVLSLLILHSFVFSILTFPENTLRLGGNTNDIINQYLVYLITSCVCGFIFRYLYLKRKERKELTQATV